MHADPARRWTVADLAAAAGLSRSAFAKRFTTLTGRPPLAYRGWWRMTLAARLLRQSDAPLSSLARKTGYASEYAFANAFKREYGIAPGRYRAMPQPTLPTPPSPRWPGTGNLLRDEEPDRQQSTDHRPQTGVQQGRGNALGGEQGDPAGWPAHPFPASWPAGTSPRTASAR